MILIISEQEDYTTIEVLKWLNYMNIEWVKVDDLSQVEFQLVSLINDEPTVIMKDKSTSTTIKLADVQAYWYRRGRIGMRKYEEDDRLPASLNKSIERYCQQESSALISFFFHLLKDLPNLANNNSLEVNKLVVLYQAKMLGLEIPKTIIVTGKENKDDHFDNESIVSKAIKESFSANLSQGWFTCYTEEIDEDQIVSEYFPALYQSRIEKESDIRIFYLNGLFYSMAIRSQDNDQTKTDFRKYVKGANSSRSFPFKLPISIELKLQRLMKCLKLKTGSIDMVLKKNGNFVFLEVNPVGQIGMTSNPCNYYLEKLIAEELIKLQHE